MINNCILQDPMFKDIVSHIKSMQPKEKNMVLRRAEYATFLYKSSLQLPSVFQSSLFENPAFNIMCDLFRTTVFDQGIAVSSCCFGAGVAPTTALRYIRLLTDMGYIKRDNDFDDGRRVFLTLTDLGVDLMNQVIDRHLRFSVN